MSRKKKPEWQRVQESQRKRRGERKRGRPEKPVKIDDTPENVARAMFGLPPIKTS